MSTISEQKVGKTPSIYIKCTYSCKRINNEKVRITVKGYGRLEYLQSWLGTGNVLQMKFTTSTVNDTSWHTLKSRDSVWEGISWHSTGEYTLDVNATSKQNIFLKCEVRGGQDNYTQYSGSISKTFNAPEALVSDKPTACGSPTGTHFVGSLGVPGERAELRWGKSKNGNRNTVESYSIRYGFGTNGPWTYATSKNNTCYLPIKENWRGKDVYAQVKARGSAGSDYDSPYDASSNTFKTNNLPPSPKASVEGGNTIFPSSNGGKKINIIIEAPITQGNQNLSIYNGSEKILEGSKRTSTKTSVQVTLPEAGQSNTYRFYTHDGLEYSHSTAITVRVNSEPTLKSEISYNNAKWYHSSSDLDSSILDEKNYYVYRINATYTTNKTKGYIKHKIRYAPIGTPVGSNSYKQINLSNITDNKSTTKTYNYVINNIISNSNIKWQIIATYNDGIEDSAPVYIPSKEKYYYIPELKLNNIYNQHGDENLVGSNPHDFYRELRFTFRHNGAYKNIAIKAVGKTKTYNAKSSPITPINRYVDDYIDATFEDGLYGGIKLGEDYTFLLEITNIDGTKKIQRLSDVRHTCTPPTLTNLQMNKSNILNPYGEEDILVNFNHSFNSGLEKDDSGKYYFKNNNLPSDWLKFYLRKSNDLSIPEIEIPSSINTLTDIDTLYDNLILNYNVQEDKFKTNLTGRHELDLSIRITNVFGCVTNIVFPRAFVLDYYSTPNEATIGSSGIEVLKEIGDTNSYKFKENNYIQEGLNLVISSELKTYSENTYYPHIEILYYNDKSINPTIIEKEEIYVSDPIFIQSSTDGKPIIQERAIMFKVPELKNYPYCSFLIKFTGNNIKPFYSKNEKGVVKYYDVMSHNKPSIISFDSKIGLDNSTSNLTKFDITAKIDNYVPNNTTLEIYTSKTSDFNTSSIPGQILEAASSQAQGSIDLELGSWKYVYQYFKVETCKSQTFGNNNEFKYLKKKTSVTSPIIVYNIQPTISYRSSSIGINNKNVAEDAIVDLSPANNKDKIYLRGPEDATMVLENKKWCLYGFIVDGGEW